MHSANGTQFLNITPLSYSSARFPASAAAPSIVIVPLSMYASQI